MALSAFWKSCYVKLQIFKRPFRSNLKQSFSKLQQKCSKGDFIFQKSEKGNLSNHNFFFCYRAVWRPVEYHNACIGVNPWKRVLVSYLLPVVIFSTLFNIPKFLEVEINVKTVDYVNSSRLVFDSITNQTYYVSVSQYSDFE